MAGDPCSSLIDTLLTFYTVKDLNPFMAWEPSMGRSHFNITILDKKTDQEVAKIHAAIDAEEKGIAIYGLTRHKYPNIRETYYKGLGQVLLYVLVCKAIQIGYSIHFKADDSNNDRLLKYYTDLGFEQQGKSRKFLTKPTVEAFYPRIEATIPLIRNSSSIESFKPLWIPVPSAAGGWIIECPVCHSKVNPGYNYLTHAEGCENRNKIADLSEKPKSGGYRRTQTKKKKNKAKRKHQSKRFQKR